MAPRVSVSASASSGLAEGVAPPSPPAESLLDIIARDTPGTSLYGAARYGAGTDNPYPIYWLDPEGASYRFVLGIASRAADVIGGIHEVTALPWWATIFAVGALIRVAMVPLTIASLRNASRAADARADIVALRHAYARATLAGAAAPVLREKLELVRALAFGVQAALHKAKCYPWHSLVTPAVQIPFVLAAVLGARHAVLLGDSSFETGGMLWFMDLTAPDPYNALPIASVALAYTSLEVIFRDKKTKAKEATSAEAKSALPSTSTSAMPAVTTTPLQATGAAMLLGNFGPFIKRALQTWMILVLPFTIEYPAGLYILMASSSTWSMAFVTLIRMPAVYKAITGRDPPSEGGEGAVGEVGVRMGVGVGAQSPAAPTSSSTTPRVPPHATLVPHFSGPVTALPATATTFRLPAALLSTTTLPVFFTSSPAFAPASSSSASDSASPNASSAISSASSSTQPAAPLLKLRVLEGPALASASASASAEEPESLASQTTETVTDFNVATATSAAAASGNGNGNATSTTAASSSAADAAILLQRSPRFVYYAARDIDLRREAADLLILRRTLNTKFPVVAGSANSLILRMAGGLQSAPWSQTVNQTLTKTNNNTPAQAAGAASSSSSSSSSSPSPSSSASSSSSSSPPSGVKAAVPSAADAATASVLTDIDVASEAVAAAERDEDLRTIIGVQETGHDAAANAAHSRLLSDAFEHMWLWSTFVMLQQPVPGKPLSVLVTKSFMGMPWTGVSSSFELPHVAPNQLERARSAAFPAAANWLRGPERRTLLSWQRTFARSNARALIASLASKGLPGPTPTPVWASLRERRKTTRTLASLGAGFGGDSSGSKASRGGQGRPASVSYRTTAFAPMPAAAPASRPRTRAAAASADANFLLRSELLAIINPPPSTPAAAQAAFLECVGDGIDTLGGGVLLEHIRVNNQPDSSTFLSTLQPNELVFCAAQSAPHVPAVDEMALLSPLSAQAATHTAVLDASTRWLELPRGMKRLSGEQRAEFDKNLLFWRQREGVLHHAVFLPRIVSLAFDAPPAQSVDAGRAFIERVKHSIGKEGGGGK